MKTNLDSHQYVRDSCRARYYQEQRHASCTLVLFGRCCAGESHLGILLALSGVVVWAGVFVGGVSVVGLRAGFKVSE
jgi:hypothetical protein